jgi:hypothetical protein
MAKMTLRQYVTEAVTAIGWAGAWWIKGLRGDADVSGLNSDDLRYLEILRKANLTPEQKQAVAHIAVSTAYSASTILHGLEGRAKTIKIVDGEGKPLIELEGINQVWLEEWGKKWGDVAAMAAKVNEPPK